MKNQEDREILNRDMEAARTYEQNRQLLRNAQKQVIRAGNEMLTQEKKTRE
jgi:hypothetical protein